MIEHQSIKVVNGPDQNNKILFAIVKGMEMDAADYLIEILDSDTELTLMNDKDEQGEGATTIRARKEKYQYQEGGHGWQGDWKDIDKDQAKALIFELAPHNLGGHWACEAAIVLTSR